MKRSIILFLASLFFIACSEDESDDIKNLSAQIQIYYIYDADWIIDRQVVDHTQLYLDITKNINIRADLYPSQYLFAWVKDNRSFNNGSITTIGAMAGNAMDMINTGNSTNSSYFDYTSNWSKHKVIINGQAFNVTLSHEEGSPTAVYEEIGDKWAVTWKIKAVTLESVYDPEKVITHTYQPSFTMMLLTTKRVK